MDTKQQVECGACKRKQYVLNATGGISVFDSTRGIVYVCDRCVLAAVESYIARLPEAKATSNA